MPNRRFINKKDMRGKDIHVGDAFEYGDCIYLVALDEENNPYIRQFENQVQYGVEAEPEYIEIESMDIEDMQFNQAEIIGDIYNCDNLMELYNRDIDIHETEPDEYDEDFDNDEE